MFSNFVPRRIQLTESIILFATTLAREQVVSMPSHVGGSIKGATLSAANQNQSASHPRPCLITVGSTAYIYNELLGFSLANCISALIMSSDCESYLILIDVRTD